ncbi:hypothetical protein DFS34DRAFT_674465 [Phlyctochytrium arcticum]|nr:hypothetical protein DFS34DRAFT_674465 [Phlyctochytrium arcticum]
MTSTQIPIAGKKMSAAYKAALINNLWLERSQIQQALTLRSDKDADTKQKYETETARSAESLFYQCEEAWTTLPRDVGNMDIKTFCVEYDGSVETYLKGMTKTRTGKRGGEAMEREELVPFKRPKMDADDSILHLLPETPLTKSDHSSLNNRDSILSTNSTSSRRMTLRSYSSFNAPTPLITIPLRGSQEVCEFDPMSYASVDEMREDMGDEKCEEALARIQDMHGQLARLLGF